MRTLQEILGMSRYLLASSLLYMTPAQRAKFGKACDSSSDRQELLTILSLLINYPDYGARESQVILEVLTASYSD